ncbi:MAG: HlyD family secretion protein [Burkholderiales bacterium]|nr:HlyD family secretion protein [Burkholderiales bacterium]
MLLGFVLLFGYALVVWLVFFKFKWLKFSIAWGFFSTFFAAHLLLIFLIGLRFVTPLATEARVIQHTIQLIPRLPEPTLVTAVLVQPNVPVKKGQSLFQFDRRPYEFKVRQLEAQLAKARQDVLVLKADTAINTQKIAKIKADLDYAKYQQQLSTSLAKQGAGPEEDAQKWTAEVAAREAGIKEAQAEETRARLRYTSDIGGVNTTVAAIQAELDLARYYLDNTLMVAPEDGYIINLQVRPGMVAGEIRLGAIASFIVDEGRYLLANYFQENLKYVKPGQEAEVALDLYPGQIFKGKVEAIWQGSGAGQMLPSGTVPNFQYVPTELPQGQFAVAIRLDGADQSKFPIGTQGRSAIYTNPNSAFVVLRKIGIRGYTWLNFIYPFSG